MIRNDEELAQATAQLARFYGALAKLRRDLRDKSPRSFAVLAEGPLEEIERLRHDVDEYTGARQLVAEEADLWLALRGETIRWRETPSSVLTAFLDSIRKGVQAIAESTRTGRYGIRPTDEVKRACDLQIVQLQPGSLQIGLRIPDEARVQGELFGAEESGQVSKALAEFVSAADWVASGQPTEQLASRFADVRHRRHVLRALRPFVPRPRGAVDQVELFGHLVERQKHIILTRDAGRRIQDAFERALEAQEERFVGEVREIDLDRRSFKLRGVAEVEELSCTYGEEMRADAEAALGKRIAAVGRRRVSQFGEITNRLDVSEIEPGE